MALRLDDCALFGPALPEPFVKFELEGKLNKLDLLLKTTGAEGKKLQADWEVCRAHLRRLGGHGGAQRVVNHVLEPLMGPLGYTAIVRQEELSTREGFEDSGWLLTTTEGAKLRVFAVEVDTDLDAPQKRGHAYRFSPSRVAQRVLLATGERIGLLTDGEELRILLCDPARPDSHIVIRLDRGGWRGQRTAPDSFRLVLALCGPGGVPKITEITEAARLSQTRVTDKLRDQAKRAVEGFIQELLDHPENADLLKKHADKATLARELWREGLIMVYRLLFVLKLESSPDPARAFSFSSTSLWRTTYSPNTALGKYARAMIDKGVETGGLLEAGLRTLFRIFAEGLDSRELRVSPLGGALFGAGSTRLIDKLSWGATAVAELLDQLLWTPLGQKKERQRVHYGSLDVEDLGRVYEALLELEPGIATEPMCRLRRDKLEVVVPAAKGAPYKKGKAKKIEHAGDIPAGTFFLRVGLGRKSTGSYYTPHAFVRFLVQESLGPQVAERSPVTDPRPDRILALNVLDPAMGSGHFLVEACRYLGEQLYEACRLCDEIALKEEELAAKERDAAKKAAGLARVVELRKRIEDLPDPNDELVAYLPSRAPEGDARGLSQLKALALCRRLVAVHCVYGVDKNPLAVELAKLSLWLESYAEGLPLTFLDHRLVCGDSLTGPSVDRLATYPGSGERIDGLLAGDLSERLLQRLDVALGEVQALEASVGKDVSDLEQKRAAKERLDQSLQPFRFLAATWAGGAMLGVDGDEHARCDDGAYLELARALASGGDAEKEMTRRVVQEMAALGWGAQSLELTFPEVVRRHTDGSRSGFDAIVGNPPWEAIRRFDDEFFAAYDLDILSEETKVAKRALMDTLMKDASIADAYSEYVASFEQLDRVYDRLFTVHQARVEGELAGRGTYDSYMLFAERCLSVADPRSGRVGLVLPSAFHAAEGATGVRRLFLNEGGLRTCFSFENREKLFEIDSRFKFALVVAGGTNEQGTVACRFYLHSPEWLFSAERERETLEYDRAFIQTTGGDYLTFLEFRSERDAAVARAAYAKAIPFGARRASMGVSLSQEVNMTYEAERFTAATKVLDEDARDPEVTAGLLEKGYLILHEGKTFHQFDDRWEDPPRYLIKLSALRDKPAWVHAAQYYRLAFRDIARATDERTAIFSLLPAGVLVANTAPVERDPQSRSNASALLVLGVANSYCFDWALRQKAGMHVNLFILDGCPIPPIFKMQHMIVHSALRLTCNHAGYANLWKEQFGLEWREATKAKRWPVLKEVDDRWALRAAIDAVVADAYGLSRSQYAHVLGTFNHKSYPAAPERCLAAFDELTKLGIDKFCRKHDPYSDLPFVEALPEPVIDLPVPKNPDAPRGKSKGKKKASAPQLGLLGEE